MVADKLKVGIIGCGNIAPAYIQGCRMFPDVINLVACADLDDIRAQQFAAQHNLQAQTVAALLDNPALDIIINLTVPAAHAEISLAVVKAGKHVYSEKPLATTLLDAQHLMQTAQQVGVRVGCAPDTFLGGGGQTSRRVIDEGRIGQPVAAVGFMSQHGPDAWHPNPFFLFDVGGGPLLDMGPYYITALVNLMGPVRRIAALAGIGLPERIAGHESIRGQKIPVNAPTHHTALLEFHNGTMATLITSFETWAHHLPIIEVYGTEGSLSMPDPNMFGGEVRLWTPDQQDWVIVPHQHRTDVQRGIGVADMAQAIQSDRPHRVSGELALHVLEVMLAAHQAAESGQYINIESRPPIPEALPQLP